MGDWTGLITQPHLSRRELVKPHGCSTTFAWKGAHHQEESNRAAIISLAIQSEKYSWNNDYKIEKQGQVHILEKITKGRPQNSLVGLGWREGRVSKTEKKLDRVEFKAYIEIWPVLVATVRSYYQDRTDRSW